MLDWPRYLCAGSALGDVLLILSTVINHRGSLLQRTLAYFSVANAVPSLLGAFGTGATSSGYWCTLQAAANWWGIWTSWLWLFAFASTLHRSFAYSRYYAVRHVHDSVAQHFVCWGAPLVAVGMLVGKGAFGPGPGLICSFNRDEVAPRIASQLVLILMLVYNLVQLVRVQLSIVRCCPITTPGVYPRCRFLTVS